MYDLFFQKLQEKVPLTDQEREQIKSYLTPKKLRKRQYLLQEGEVCKAIAFVEKGALREYSVENGSEHILQFAIEGWTISDLFSFLTGEQATYNIDALEDAELVLITRSAHEELLKAQPKYETYMRLLITGAYIALQRRLTSNISLPVEERYTSFTEMYPDIAQRVPQHMIASFMGVKPETLSRIRKKMADQK
ncbi:Crp/Fnr family transcriptional regulator [Pontibacter diazotrophicus]|uniref:Crp/Fnr family transcriptional regulator n=1 Tax=Pontibacter diazotrophicus TaxID=1400979 RepID=A0A3D8LGD3_9BACT|nr:Crp/Fnr family transcriptional regulator [Pontibacter diazotrophicus]RDV16519.1 Crp/Fnr family transcriptional regulator [Pontibacter diazotrophicus]